jgi:hypothetical protein
MTAGVGTAIATGESGGDVTVVVSGVQAVSAIGMVVASGEALAVPLGGALLASIGQAVATGDLSTVVEAPAPSPSAPQTFAFLIPQRSGMVRRTWTTKPSPARKAPAKKAAPRRHRKQDDEETAATAHARSIALADELWILGLDDWEAA